jgi:membrane protease YdiL (CAAX protease family)
VAAGATFPLSGAADRKGVVVGTIGSCVIFAAGHGQYPVPLRVVLGVVAVIFVWPWVKARSLWAPWIPHTLGDVIGDTILTL